MTTRRSISNEARRELVGLGLVKMPGDAGSAPACWVDPDFIRDPKDEEQVTAVFLQRAPAYEPTQHYKSFFKPIRLAVTVWTDNVKSGFDLCDDIVDALDDRRAFDLGTLRVEQCLLQKDVRHWAAVQEGNGHRFDFEFELRVLKRYLPE